ncbi:MAG: hypothetical protein WDZ28_00460 [Simkaniaceae bacterium]
MIHTIPSLLSITLSQNSAYLDRAQELVNALLPKPLQEAAFDSKEAFFDQLDGCLPLVLTKGIQDPGSSLFFYLLCRHRRGVNQFFYDMIQRWLLPGSELNINLIFGADFSFIHRRNSLYFVSELGICVDSVEKKQLIRRNFETLSREIRLGVASQYQANRILELKGFSVNQKTAKVHERLALTVQKLPQLYESDIFVFMQRFFISTNDVYKAVRSSRHLFRMIYLYYLMQKGTVKQRELYPRLRHLRVKVMALKLQDPLGTKTVYGVFISFNYLSESEVFERRHFKRALRNLDKDFEIIEDSFLNLEAKEERLITAYIEIEKKGSRLLTLKELIRIRRELPHEIKVSIERLLRPVFMPRNEEEVMRNIVILSGQLKFVRDIPQVIISFDEQREESLFFTITFVRLLRKGSKKVEDLFREDSIFSIERVKKVGKLRKRTLKEALVLRAEISSSPFIRQDHHLDLYRAREYLLIELQRIAGEVRDYNGGMISKQNELFISLQEALGDLGEKNRLLLEHFFHSIYPTELRSLLHTEPLRHLFLMLKAELGQTKVFFEQDEKNSYFLIGVKSAAAAEKIRGKVSKLIFGRLELALLSLSYFEMTHLGYILSSKSEEKIIAIHKAIEEGLDL